MITLLDWCLGHWYVFFWLTIFGVFGAVRDFFVDTAKVIGGVGEKKHKRRMKELRLQAAISAAPGEPRPKPGPCVHRNVTPVISAADELVAWLCRTCDSRLPADWAVREEDL